ncbi:16S rRNA (guanine(527)-N(7))-methyltransferase RsmG [Desulfocurvus sp. DL9XJH121]
MRKPSPNDVAALARTLGRDLDDAQADLLARYLEGLVKWNKAMNLVGAETWDRALTDLAADSWHLADFLAGLQADGGLPEAPRTLDLGSGAGLPGIPLRVFWEAGEYVLVEPRAKRTAFMRFILAQMNLRRTSVAQCRVEALDPALLPVDLVLSRAFMPWEGLLPLAATLAGPAGRCVVMANERPPAGADGCGGWRLDAVRAYPGGGGERYFWSFSPASSSA